MQVYLYYEIKTEASERTRYEGGIDGDGTRRRGNIVILGSIDHSLGSTWSILNLLGGVHVYHEKNLYFVGLTALGRLEQAMKSYPVCAHPPTPSDSAKYFAGWTGLM